MFSWKNKTSAQFWICLIPIRLGRNENRPTHQRVDSNWKFRSYWKAISVIPLDRHHRRKRGACCREMPSLLAGDGLLQHSSSSCSSLSSLNLTILRHRCFFHLTFLFHSFFYRELVFIVPFAMNDRSDAAKLALRRIVTVSPLMIPWWKHYSISFLCLFLFFIIRNVLQLLELNTESTVE